MITAIVCIDKNNGIGKDGELLFHIKKDMERFKSLTTGGTIICGRKTYESFKERPLSDRTNIVITNKAKNKPEVINDNLIYSKLNNIKVWLTQKDVIEQNNGIHIVGGGKIYSELLNLCERLYITRVDSEKEADTFFPEVRDKKEWELIKSTTHTTNDGITYHFETWDRCDYSILGIENGFDNDLIISVKTFNNVFSVIAKDSNNENIRFITDWEYLDNEINVSKFIKKLKEYLN